MNTKIMDYLIRKPRSFIWVTGLLLNLTIGIIDYLMGCEIGLAVVYLLPIGLLAWLINRKAVIIMSVTGAVTIISTDLLAGKVIKDYFN